MSMIMTRRELLAAAGTTGALAFLGSNSGVSAGQDAGPNARPTSPEENITPGQHALNLGDARDGLLYVPRGYKTGVAAPLIVMLHGAGGSGYSAISRFSLADEFGFIMLAPDSRDERTWDALLSGFGPDAEFIGTALRYTFARCRVDPQRVGLAGVSDGASYALSLGIGAGDVFSRIIAFSPGAMRPNDVRGKPHIFISHGTSDPVMPIDITSRRFVTRLKALGYDVTYREFDGGHSTPPSIAHEAFEWFAVGH